MSWVSTRTYYEHINRFVQHKGDPYASAPLLIESLDFAQLHALRASQDLLPPDLDNSEVLDRIIYDELIVGKVTRDAERALKTMITVKEQDGAEAIVLACTELEMVVDVDANVLPIYDSTRIHAEKAAEW